MTVSYARSGQITVASAGTAVQGPDVPGAAFLLKAAPANTNPVWIGNVSGDVDNSNGLGLKAADNGIEICVSNLSLLYFDATTSGEKICWLRLR
jgi:hypothetical protein